MDTETRVRGHDGPTLLVDTDANKDIENFEQGRGHDVKNADTNMIQKNRGRACPTIFSFKLNSQKTQVSQLESRLADFTFNREEITSEEKRSCESEDQIEYEHTFQT